MEKRGIEKKRIFISQPMKGKTEEEILSGRENALEQLKSICLDF
jgi:hypothetical protein